MANESVYDLSKMTSVAVKEFLKKKPKPVLVLVLGSVEQHGPHLPLGTDSFCALKRAREICRRTDSILFQPFMLGYSPNHVSYAGTVSLAADTMLALLRDVFQALGEMGFDKVLIHNGHATNEAVISLAVTESKRNNLQLQIAYPKFFPKEKWERFRQRYHENLDIHAGPIETMIVRELYPELVDENCMCWNYDNRPESIRKLQQKDERDEIDGLLMETFLPSNYAAFSESGVLGVSKAVPNVDMSERIREGHRETIESFVDLIERWKASEAVHNDLKYNFYIINNRINYLLKKNFDVEVFDSPLALDLGAGAGINSRFLKDKGYEVLSFDISELSVAAAKKNGITIILKDIATIELSDYEDIRLVLCNYVLQNFTTEMGDRLLRQVFESLCPGAFFLVSIFEERNGLSQERIMELSVQLGYDIVDIDSWARLDEDHGPPHWHKGCDILLRKVFR